jgi:hypothetical protein
VGIPYTGSNISFHSIAMFYTKMGFPHFILKTDSELQFKCVQERKLLLGNIFLYGISHEILLINVTLVKHAATNGKRQAASIPPSI